MEAIVSLCSSVIDFEVLYDDERLKNLLLLLLIFTSGSLMLLIVSEYFAASP